MVQNLEPPHFPILLDEPDLTLKSIIFFGEAHICAAPVKGVNVMTFQFISQDRMNMIRVFRCNTLQDLRHPVENQHSVSVCQPSSEEASELN